MMPAVKLAAEPYVFTSTGQILFFYVREVARRLSVQVPLEIGITVPRLTRDQREATYARIVAALHEREPEDYDFDPPMTEERLEALVHWYMSDMPNDRLISHFADALDLRSETWPAFQRECMRTRNCFRRRMVARRLVG